LVRRESAFALDAGSGGIFGHGC